MLTQYIRKLAACDDVRVKNREVFRLTRYRDYKTDMVSKLVEDLYNNKNWLFYLQIQQIIYDTGNWFLISVRNISNLLFSIKFIN